MGPALRFTASAASLGPPLTCAAVDGRKWPTRAAWLAYALGLATLAWWGAHRSLAYLLAFGSLRAAVQWYLLLAFDLGLVAFPLWLVWALGKPPKPKAPKAQSSILELEAKPVTEPVQASEPASSKAPRRRRPSRGRRRS